MKSNLYFVIGSFVLFLLADEKTNAQAPDWLWAKSIGGIAKDHGYAITVDPSGNVYTTGDFTGTVDFDPGVGTFNLTSTGANDIFISKLDRSGNFVWAKAMGGTGSDIGRSIVLDHKGNIYIAGDFSATVDFNPGADTLNLISSGSNDIFISKLDSSGNFIWAKSIGGVGKDFGYAIAVDFAENVYVTGSFSGTVDFDPDAGTFNLISTGNADMFIFKLDSYSNFVWAESIGGTGIDAGYSLALDLAGSGDINITGIYTGTVDFDPGPAVFNLTSVNTNSNIFISKFDSSGNFIWAKAIGGAGIAYAYSLALDPSGSGDVYTTGYFQGKVDFDPGPAILNLPTAGDREVFISKLDSSGNLVWAKSMGGAGFDIGYSIAFDSSRSGAVYITGSYFGTSDFDPGAGIFNLTSASGDFDIFISKLDSYGNFLWAKSIGGITIESIPSMTIDALGQVYLTGSFASPLISFNASTLINADSTGNFSDIFIAKLGGDIPSSVVQIKTQDINIYPNPTKNELTIDFDKNKLIDLDITMYNIVGEVVFSIKNKNIAQEKTIDISKVARGIYFIELDMNGNRVMKKLVKE